MLVPVIPIHLSLFVENPFRGHISVPGAAISVCYVHRAMDLGCLRY
jgi:hypothetical protein